ncbi:MAG: LptF/LptG family permease [Candidatus Spyradosoma sp.]
MIPIIDRHILKEWLKIFLMALCAMAGMLLISSIYNDLQDMIQWEVPTFEVVEFFFMTTVGFLPVVIPVSLLVSLLFILGHFHKNQELTAWRAAGLGIFRITRSLWVAGAALSLLMLFLNATFVPYATERTTQIVQKYDRSGKSGEFIFYNNVGARRIWLISNFKSSTGEARNVNIYEFDAKSRLKREIAAATGVYDEATGTWTLADGREMEWREPAAGGPPSSQKTFDKLAGAPADASGNAKPLRLLTRGEYPENPRLMLLASKPPRDLSLPEIGEILDRSGGNASEAQLAEYSVYYNSILASPFCCLIVVGIAIPFAVSGVRTNPMVGVSKSIGLFAAYFLLTNIFNAVGSKLWLPPVVAAWAPNVLLFVYAAWLCRKVN